ncbi:hypothetical protein KGF86_13535 [Ornithinibacillus massiliensis]|uniref:Uncharacterized protein n=1 Tax=Ornithinibacillus massiliensis TaxID=1944633 RepID=A0ABS5MFY0_9BACI|nr:hypothetical protein [Ornithinibacillus massiliensis]MBS3681225.1 hypothetical protein [Ornithinibacillus massiliensis]
MDNWKLENRKYEDWKQLNSKYLREINNLIHDMKPEKQLQIISYFNHSFNISHTKELDNFCIGTFHLINVGAVVLNNPFICIRIDSEDEFEFSGKYIYQDSLKKNRMTQAWERFNDPKDKHEYWLRPVEKKLLAKGDMISFSNFQLKWKSLSSYTFRLNAFVYGDEIMEGQNSINDIHIKGTLAKESNTNG